MSKQIKQSLSDAWSDACEAERKAQESVKTAEYREKIALERVRQVAECKESAIRDWERAFARAVIANSELKRACEAKESLRKRKDSQ